MSRKMRWGSSSNNSLNGQLHLSADIDGPLNEAATDKILQYRADYNDRPSNTISFVPVVATGREGDFFLENEKNIFETSMSTRL